MSDYLQSLDSTAKDRYIRKLQVLGLTEEDDPYAARNGGKFTEDMTLATGGVRAYILLFCGAPWSLHAATANAMEEFRCL